MQVTLNVLLYKGRNRLERRRSIIFKQGSTLLLAYSRLATTFALTVRTVLPDRATGSN